MFELWTGGSVPTARLHTQGSTRDHPLPAPRALTLPILATFAACVADVASTDIAHRELAPRPLADGWLLRNQSHRKSQPALYLV